MQFTYHFSSVRLREQINLCAYKIEILSAVQSFKKMKLIDVTQCDFTI
ncbi:MAG: hypothetical protein FWD71_22940 [Oscillospiraceae bacterium]|nr:hypothetical protein [Oscillospiraceae bacterium]